jgi:Na+/H+-translocating membrane pyrophosphatase
VADRHATAVPAAAVVAQPSPGVSSAALVLALVGLLIAGLALGSSFVPLWALPPSMMMRFERNRHSIAMTGLGIGLGCALIGILGAVGGL